MAKHKHEVLEITTLYRKDRIPEIELVKCRDCNTAFPELIEMLQNRENLGAELRGENSPVIFWNPDTMWAEQKTLHTKFELISLPHSTTDTH